MPLVLLWLAFLFLAMRTSTVTFFPFREALGGSEVFGGKRSQPRNTSLISRDEKFHCDLGSSHSLELFDPFLEEVRSRLINCKI